MPYLYIVRCQDFHKIGIATNIESRIASLQTGNPFAITVTAYYEFDSPSAVEQVLHQKFCNKRILGEWFNLSSDDLAAIDKICKMLDGKKQSEAVVVTEQDAAEAESLGVINDDAPIDDRIEKLLADGWRMERYGCGKYRGRYCRLRKIGGRETMNVGKISSSIEALLSKRTCKRGRPRKTNAIKKT